MVDNGDLKNSNDHVTFLASDGDTPFGTDPLRSKSSILVCCLVAPLGVVINSGGILVNVAFGRFNSSRSSFAVKAASSGPLLETMETCSIAEALRTSRTCSGMSSLESMDGGVRNSLAMSSETLPCPMSVRCRTWSNDGGEGFEGWPVYQ